MQMPGHVVSMYVATCGQNGPGLGSDEKEIILLVYVIIDAVTNVVVGIKQYLVKPTGMPGRERQSQQGPVITNAIESPATSPTNITIINNINNNSNNINNNINNNNIINNNNNNLINTPVDAQTTIAPIIVNPELPIAVAQAAGQLLNEAIEQFDAYIRSLSIDPDSSTEFKLITDGQLPIRQCLHPEACAKDIELPSYYLKFSDLRKEYVRYKSADLSRALVPVKDIKKLPQMPALPPLPLSIADMMKELDLTSTEDKEFYVKESRDMVTVIQSLITAGHKFESNEIVNLSLEPGICSIDDEIDGSCIVRARGLPWQSSDQDIAKFFRGLNVAKGGVALCLSPLGRRNGEALVRFISQEHRDMALKRHKHHIGNRYIEVYRATGEDFLSVAGGASNEAQAFLSKGAQVIIRMRGLPYDCTAKQVLDFFTAGENPCNVLDGNDGVLFVKKPDGRATGDAFVLFANESDAPHALQRHRESIGQRYIELFRSTTAEVQQVLNRSMDPKTYEQQPPLIQLPPPVLLPQCVITSGTTKNCIRLRGLPFEARVEHILHFLDDFAKNIIYQGVHMVFNAQGQPSGEAFIQMDSEEAARLCAQQKHNQFMVFGKKYRYIEVFQCSGDDMNLVLNGGLQSPGNPTKPALLSPGMLPQAQQARTQTVTHSHLHNPHHPHHHPQSAVAVSAAAVAAVAAAAASQQNQHSHFTTAGSPATGALTPYTLTQHQSAAAGALTHHPHLHPQHSFSIQAAAAAAQNMVAHQPPPLTLSIPPPSNPALLAQQQAQFIAQQSLLARQNAAAAAAAAHNEQFLNYHNFALMPAHGAGGTPIGISPHHPNAAAAVAAAGQQQYFFMPRPYLHHPMNSLGLMSSHQFHPLQFASPAAVTAAGLQAGLSQPIKRSYDNAFQQDVNAVSAPKRQLTRPPGNVYGFYHPGGGTLLGPPFGAFSHFGPSSILPPPHRAHPGAYYPPQLVYWPYPSPPVSPTTYFGPAPPPPHVAPNLPAQHQALYPVDFIPSPTTYHHAHMHPAHQQTTPIGSPPIQATTNLLPSTPIAHQQFSLSAAAVPAVSTSAMTGNLGNGPTTRSQSILSIDTNPAAVIGTNQKFTGHHHHHRHHHIQTNGHILSPNASPFALATAGSSLAAVPTINPSHYVELYIA